MTISVPALLSNTSKDQFPALIDREQSMLNQARKLFNAGFYDHALLDIWSAAVSNLRRKVEAYGVELFESVIKDEPGRKKYDKNGETLTERWSGVDDLTLISGATKLGLLNKKAGKSLEMINWMRNHASPAHDSDHKVEEADVIALALMLQSSLFEAPLPDPGHSVSGLFDPIRNATLSAEQMGMMLDQVVGLKAADIKVAFGFLLDLLCKGEEPALTNTRAIFPSVWKRGSEDLYKTVGIRYQGYKISPDADTSHDKGAAGRLLDLLTQTQGIKYIPDGARCSLYRHAAKLLAAAKDTTYGWGQELSAAKTLAQFGPHVPTAAFTEVYQEIISVWCGNFWGSSDAEVHFVPFIDTLNTSQILEFSKLFYSNERAKAELFQAKPKARAIALLQMLQPKLTIQAHIDELNIAISTVKSL
ncbi:hypothetical protein NRB14_17020 [Pseudomonas viridiflava]|uniref:hypothetical protein n=1 Tax=Pseudomonas viridiflava TaxID=33069 RepID=UPI00211D6D81|nr:hypothetical protein [Pseudomonas viridiflava]MCQ9393304.1 hypothetical protein [Pseudomonas viridiflava]